ncbi:MAG TPA: thiol reductase thioredoxin [Oceanospirillales bacterium]|nr:thiol reductase thioredoxin [Oceanospirillaceae bacterium]MAR01784.1 thiol reductase thioredoxin [Oceanospirillaceae bacterium]HBS42022.1 thiol reductase thioredoxin [Oceanospirillales bacterium]|tara:strand:+ start:76599 stop:76928 length:330 start_codon:yes stop_codon:yes gene_type:complete
MRQLSAEDNFTRVVQEKDWVLIYFTAAWCGPCKIMGPVMEEVAAASAESVTVIKADVDQFPALAAHYSLRGVPALLLFNKGNLVDRKVGSAPPQMVSDWINQSRNKRYE